MNLGCTIDVADDPLGGFGTGRWVPTPRRARGLCPIAPFQLPLGPRAWRSCVVRRAVGVPTSRPSVHTRSGRP
jgi:hypothetical protein